MLLFKRLYAFVTVPDFKAIFDWFFFNLHATLFVTSSRHQIHWQENIWVWNSFFFLFFDVYVTFYVCMFFFFFFFFYIRHQMHDKKWRLHISAHGSESQYDVQITNFRTRLENTQKFIFDFVPFLFSLSIIVLSLISPLSRLIQL